jgi:hypothetical protein
LTFWIREYTFPLRNFTPYPGSDDGGNDDDNDVDDNDDNNNNNNVLFM